MGLLAALLCAAAPGPAASPGGLLDRMTSLNPNLRAFTATLHAHVTMKSFPFLSAGNAYDLQIAGDAIALGTWVMGLDILVGYTGLVSFGHAAWLAAGAAVVLIFLLTAGYWNPSYGTSVHFFVTTVRH